MFLLSNLQATGQKLKPGNHIKLRVINAGLALGLAPLSSFRQCRLNFMDEWHSYLAD
jgi:hypothetical protein